MERATYSRRQPTLSGGLPTLDQRNELVLAIKIRIVSLGVKLRLGLERLVPLHIKAHPRRIRQR